MFDSDLPNFSIYVYADEAYVERWFEECFLKLRETMFRDEFSYFHTTLVCPSEKLKR